MQSASERSVTATVEVSDLRFPQVPGLWRMGWPVGRVLSVRPKPGGATIHLRRPLPAASSDLPVCSGGPPSNAHCLILLRVGFT